MYIFIFKSKELQVGGPLLSINLLNHILFALVVVCGELDPSIHLLDSRLRLLCRYKKHNNVLSILKGRIPHLNCAIRHRSCLIALIVT